MKNIVTFLLLLSVVISIDARRKDSVKFDDVKIIEYHENECIDHQTQQVLKQFANAADAVLVMGTHPKDKRLIVTKIAQLIADFTKFIVEATRKVCLINELDDNEQTFQDLKMFNYSTKEKDIELDEDFDEAYQEMIEAVMHIEKILRRFESK